MLNDLFKVNCDFTEFLDGIIDDLVNDTTEEYQFVTILSGRMDMKCS